MSQKRKTIEIHLSASFADNSHTFVAAVKNHQRVNEPLHNVETMNERNPVHASIDRKKGEMHMWPAFR